MAVCRWGEVNTACENGFWGCERQSKVSFAGSVPRLPRRQTDYHDNDTEHDSGFANFNPLNQIIVTLASEAGNRC